MSDALTLAESLEIKHVDPQASERNFRGANQRFPSYFRSLRNFCECLPRANWAGGSELRSQAAIHFPSITAHVAIV
jgi:hypothetical protein